VLFLAACALAGLVFFFLSLGGVSAAILSVRLGRGEGIARSMLGGVFGASIFISVLVGTGPRAAFSDLALRPFPLSTVFRFIARHQIGLLDPIWLLHMAVVLGLIIGFTIFGSGRIFVGLAGGWLFLIANYLASITLISLFDCLLQRKGGATILFGAIFALFAIAPFLIVNTSEQIRHFHLLSQVSRFTPPAAAAKLITGPGFADCFFSIAILIIWCIAAVVLASALERGSRMSTLAMHTGVSWSRFHDQLTYIFGRVNAPLVEKALLYHLRCNRIRFNLVATPFMIALVGKLMVKSGSQEILFVTLCLFFIAGLGTTNAISLNQFGYDDSGIRRYLTLPVAFVQALRAGSYVSLFIGGVANLAGLALWSHFSVITVETRIITLFLEAGIAGLFFFNGLGVWVSVLSPRRAKFRSVVGNQLSLGGNLVMFGGLLLAIITTGVLVRYCTLSGSTEHWWVLLPLVFFCLSFYFASLHFVSAFLESRRERLVDIIAGA
jgi:hypothetical protein